MSKYNIDYSNTIVYKITCKDPSIQDVYVGHTVNFVQRKKAHQLSCMNSNYSNHNCKVYNVIRNNGGWDNWSMGIIAFYNCKDLDEARQKEQAHFVALNATMNSIEPFPSKSVNRVKRVNRVNCIKCVKRVRPVGRNTVMPNGKKRVYICEKCDFICSKQSIYNKHLETTKHKTNRYILPTPPDSNNIGYVCPYCLKSYKYHSGIWRHKKECKHNNSYLHDEYEEYDDHTLETQNVIIRRNVNPRKQTTDNKIKNLTAENRQMKIEMARMLSIVANNTQFQTQLLEFMKTTQSLQVGNTIPAAAPSSIGVATNGDHNTNTINSNNNTFNMNMFLNEQCKDAMNMKDFVNSIQLNLTDLENVGNLGYVKGMSNILIDNLQKMDVYKRPVHCSDVKRDTLYVKENNEWERDGPDHPKMVNAVLAVEHKNVALVSEWAKANPRCMNSNTRENERYMKLSKAATDGEKEGNIAKVIKRVAKNVTIDKAPNTIE